MKKLITKILNSAGYTIQKVPTIKNHMLLFSDIKENEFWEIYNLCKPFTMTSIERMYALYCSVVNILANNTVGDFVECGVWQGGSSMMIAKILHNRGIIDRKIYLYDTFEGMSEPTDNDIDFNGSKASKLLVQTQTNKETSVWCLAELNDVQKNLKLTKFPVENVIFIKGKVENTLPGNLPFGYISLLRLDTDWYESTKQELKYLYPKLGLNGVLIIDDYGHWEGCRKAVDEYFNDNNINLLIHRIDYTGRIVIKTTM